MLFVVVSPSVQVTGALSHRLGRVTLQHVDDVHTVDVLQGGVYTLHWMENTQSHTQEGEANKFS